MTVWFSLKKFVKKIDKLKKKIIHNKVKSIKCYIENHNFVSPKVAPSNSNNAHLQFLQISSHIFPYFSES